MPVIYTPSTRKDSNLHAAHNDQHALHNSFDWTPKEILFAFYLYVYVTLKEIILGSLKVIALGISIAATAFLGLTVYTAIFHLTWPSVVRALATPSSMSLISCITLIGEGIIAGLVIGTLRKFFELRSKIGQSVLSKIISFRVFALDDTFIPTLFLSIVVAGVVGFIARASGFVGLSNILIENNHFIPSGTPLMAIVSAAAAGGGGAGGGGLFGSKLLFLLMIIIAFVIQGAIIGALSGLTLGILFGALKGAARSGIMSGIVGIVSSDAGALTRRESVLKSARTGVILGAIVGSIVGMIQGVVVIAMLHLHGPASSAPRLVADAISGGRGGSIIRHGVS